MPEKSFDRIGRTGTLRSSDVVRITKNLIEWIRSHKVPIVTMSALVVIVTTYSLILPAITLTPDKAKEQGGISVSVSEEEQEPAGHGSPDQSPQPEEEKGDSEGGSTYNKDDQNHDGSEGGSKEQATSGNAEKGSEDSGKARKSSASGSDMPAALFAGEIKEGKKETTSDGGCDAERVEEAELSDDTLIRVIAEAEEGTFPEGTSMKIREVTDDKDVRSRVEQALDGAAVVLRAVDITFTDAVGKEIEPEKKVKITLVSDAVGEMDQKDPVIVHVPDKGAAEVIEKTDKEAGLTVDRGNSEVSFRTDQFSPYVMAVRSSDVTTETKAAQTITVGDVISLTVIPHSGNGHNNWTIPSIFTLVSGTETNDTNGTISVRANSTGNGTIVCESYKSSKLEKITNFPVIVNAAQPTSTSLTAKDTNNNTISTVNITSDGGQTAGGSQTIRVIPSAGISTVKAVSSDPSVAAVSPAGDQGANASGNLFTITGSKGGEATITITGEPVSDAYSAPDPKTIAVKVSQFSLSETGNTISTTVNVDDGSVTTIPIYSYGVNAGQPISSDSTAASAMITGSNLSVSGIRASSQPVTITVKGTRQTGYAELAGYTLTITVNVNEAADSVYDLANNDITGLTVSIQQPSGQAKKRLNDYKLVIREYNDQILNQDYDAVESAVMADTGDSSFDFLKMYHVYFARANDNTSDPAEVPFSEVSGGRRLNLKVTMTYSTRPVGMPVSGRSLKVGHYKINGQHKVTNAKITNSNGKNGTDIKSVTISGNSITFHVNSFSVITLSAGHTSYTAAGTEVTTQQGSILNGSTYFNDANEWQIVSGGYVNNTAAYKTGNNGGSSIARIQKNVIPTGTENEFYVYMSVDTKHVHAITNTNTTAYLENPSNYESWTSNTANTTPGHIGVPKGSLKTQGDRGHVTCVLRYNGKIVAQGSCNAGVPNSHVYLKVGAQHILLGHYGKGSSVTFDVTLDQEAYTALFSVIQNMYSSTEDSDIADSSYIRIKDTMNNRLVYDGPAAADPGSGIMTTTESGNNVLVWTPKRKTSPITTTPVTVEHTEGSGSSTVVTSTETSYWNLNVMEAVYKVHLDVTSSGFTSGTAYDVYSRPSLIYGSSSSNTQTLNFNNLTIPQVRGTLYEFEFDKVDDNNTALTGARFRLEGPSDNPFVSSSVVKLPADPAAGANMESISDFEFTGLPWGTYVLTEIKTPPGYTKAIPATIILGYTEDFKDTDDGLSRTLTTHAAYGKTQGSVVVGDQSADLAFPGEWIGRNTGAGHQTRWKVVDKKNRITVNKIVEVENISSSIVDHQFYIALQDKATGSYVKCTVNGRPNTEYTEITITDGAASPSKLEFTDIGSGIYDVVELSDLDWGGSLLNTGALLGTAPDEFQLFQITSENTYTNEDGETVQDTNNDADIRYDNEAEVSLTNTYGNLSTLSFVAKKKWGRNKAEVDPPSGGSVTFQIYQRYISAYYTEPGSYSATETFSYRIPQDSNGHDIGPITLDGVVDQNGEVAPWQARFTDLPNYYQVDPYDTTSSATYKYIVVETSHTPASGYMPYKNTLSTVPLTTTRPGDTNDSSEMYQHMYSSGGTIWNLNDTAEITIKKVKEDRSTFLEGSSFELYKVVNNVDQRIGSGAVSITSASGYTFTGLEPGDYKLIETSAPPGYVIQSDPIEFTVSAVNEDAITWKNGIKPNGVLDLSKTTVKSDTITVVNTPGAELPATGGPGTTALQTGGMILVIMAIAGLALRAKSGRSGGPPGGPWPFGGSERIETDPGIEGSPPNRCGPGVNGSPPGRCCKSPVTEVRIAEWIHNEGPETSDPPNEERRRRQIWSG